MKSPKLGTVHNRLGVAAKQNYRVSEIKRLLSEGVSLSKSAKLLGIKYELAKTLSTLA
jgi:hypothetical protein